MLKSHLVKGDKTSGYYYDPESKSESMEWKHAGWPRTKTFKVTQTIKTLMATVFWDADGVIHGDYLPRGTTINGQYYDNLLLRLCDSIKATCCGKLRCGILLEQDNAPVYASQTAMRSVRDCVFELLPHPPCSPAVAPRDYYPFSKLKTKSRGLRYDDDNELTTAVREFFRERDLAFNKVGIDALPARWTKYLEFEGD